MPRRFSQAAGTALLIACFGNEDGARPSAVVELAATASLLAVINVVGMDTLSDSASIHHLRPEPDGGSVAFLFADPTKGVRRGLGLVETSGSTAGQLAWPDSVNFFWWSGAHQLSFTAGTGKGVRIVVDAHAAQLEAIQAADSQSHSSNAPWLNDSTNAVALSRAQVFIDSIRVQPGGRPQGSTLRYQADTVIIAPTDSFAAVHVSARNSQGAQANPAWYLTHMASGHIRAIDSLTGTSTGLPASAGQWGADGNFYYAKERTIWRARPKAQLK